jgi:hypothetical protein
VALRSHHGKYLVCDDLVFCDNVVKADRSAVQEWEMWALMDHPDAMTDPGNTARLAIQGLCVAGKVLLTIAGQPALASLVPSNK